METELKANQTIEKEEALEHLVAIRSHLVDKQIFFPYNYNATYIWSIITVVLTFMMIPMYERSILVGTVFIFIIIAIGFVSEGVMTKKVNMNYDIEDCTSRQRFIMKNFMMMSLFLIVMSTALASYKLYVPIYLMWMFLISLGYYAIGYVLNIRLFSKMAQFNISLSIILLTLAVLREHLVGKDSFCIILVQCAVLLALCILPAIVAWKQIKEGK